MSKVQKKILSVMLCAAMILSAGAFTAFAEGEEAGTQPPTVTAGGETEGQPPEETEGKGEETAAITTEEALRTALEKGGEVTLGGDITLTSYLSIDKEVTLDLNGHTISGEFSSFTDSYKGNLINVVAGNVTITNGTLTAGSNNRNVVSVIGATGVTLSGVTLDHSTAAKGAPLIVGGSTVTLSGNVEMILGEKSWYAINVDSKNETEANVTFESNVRFNVTGATEDKNVIFVENNSKEHPATVTNPENAGLVAGENGTYNPKPADPEQPPVNPEQPPVNPETPETPAKPATPSTGISTGSSVQAMEKKEKPNPADQKAMETYNFWMTVKANIKKTKDGKTLRVNVPSDIKNMPASVMETIRLCENDVTVVLKWNGRTITISTEEAVKKPARKVFWSFKQLVEMYA